MERLKSSINSSNLQYKCASVLGKTNKKLLSEVRPKYILRQTRTNTSLGHVTVFSYMRSSGKHYTNEERTETLSPKVNGCIPFKLQIHMFC